MEQSQPQEQTEQQSAEELVVHRCAMHPDVETGLACGKCGKYICPRCMIQTPVGGRCSSCARVTKLPTFDVTPTYYVRAGAAGVVVALLAGLVWGFLLSATGFFLAWLLAIGVGYLVSEAISVAANRKRGTGLAVIAGASMLIFALFSGLLAWVFLLGNIFGLFSLGVAFYIAVSRVR